MAEKLTIQERIAQQLMATLDAALPTFLTAEVGLSAMTAAERQVVIDTGTHRFDSRGLDLPWFVPLLVSGPGDVSDESVGDGGYVTMEYGYKVQAHFGVVEGVDLSSEPARGSERMGTRWIGFLVETLLADSQVIETATAEPLAYEVDLVGVDLPRSKVDGQLIYAPEVEVVVMSEVERTNPYRGAGNTERTV